MKWTRGGTLDRAKLTMQLQLVQTVIDGFTCQPIRNAVRVATIRSPPQAFLACSSGVARDPQRRRSGCGPELCELVGVAGVLLAFRAARHLLLLLSRGNAAKSCDDLF